MKIDEVDRKILSALIENARISYSDLAEKVGLSRVRVRDRVVELQEKGVIEKFTIQIPSRYLGKPLPAFFNVHATPNHIEKAAETISSHPDIVIVYQMTGANDLHVHGFFHDIDDVSTFINDYLSKIEGITNVETQFLLSRYKAERSLMV